MKSAMSTTPTTSDTPYTVVGGTRVQRGADELRGISALVLDRGSRTIRADSLERLAGCGVDEVLIVLGPAPHYDVEQLAARISNTRFLLLGNDVSAGEKINIGIHESASPLVVVLWSDNELPRLTDRVIEHMTGDDALCHVPTIWSDRSVMLPSVTAPAFHGKLFRIVPTQPGKSTNQTLFPYEYIGVYGQDRFIRLGGYDPKIRNPYWQRLDFGMRAYLWGEQILVSPELRVNAAREIPPDDTTPDAGYARFYLKNLAVKFTGDNGRLQVRALFSVVFRSGLRLSAAVRLFREVRDWVDRYRYRFVQDAGRVTELWEAHG